mmetsp:Transcript_8766/g.12101  ORF Transcript_8766/g.12101 Transcript_8766/m.12101 type:complete len:98 (-) Transcript_8766:75-368(-)
MVSKCSVKTSDRSITVTHPAVPFAATKIKKKGYSKYLEVRFLGITKRYRITDEVKLVQQTQESSSRQTYCVALEIPTYEPLHFAIVIDSFLIPLTSL